MSSIVFTGDPLLSISYYSIPSWNDVIAWSNQRPRFAQHDSKASRVILNSHVAKWRKNAEVLARINIESMRNKGFHVDPYLVTKRAVVLIKVVRGTERKYDIPNVWVKAILDGFTDARVWHDDEWAYVPATFSMWWDGSDDPTQRFVVEVHELDELVLNGRPMTLPTGRRGDGQWWLDA
jgi:Holliday junction resolvase RusA-like endonuclease